MSSVFKSYIRKLEKTPLCAEIQDCGLPATEASIRKFERSVGHSLPKDYFAFLLHYNGGLCRWGSFDLEGRSAGERAQLWPGFFQMFSLGCADWADWMDLRYQFERHEGRIPTDTIPIGESGGDNLVLLNLAKGHIGFWERDAELHLDANENWVYAASSFLDFATRVEIETSKERRLGAVAERDPERAVEVDDIEGLKKWVQKQSEKKILKVGSELLCLACEQGSIHCARHLLDLGIDPDSPNANGKTPIELADEGGIGDVVVLLLENGADRGPLFKGRRKPQPYIAAFIEQFDQGLRSSTR